MTTEAQAAPTLETIAAEADAARSAEIAEEAQARSGLELEASSSTGAEPPTDSGDGASHSKPDPKAKAAKPKEEPAKEPVEGGSLAQLRKRWSDGDIEGVLRLVSGEKDLAKLPMQPALRALRDERRKATARTAEAERRRLEVSEIADRLEARHKPMVEAQQAWASGDVERAVKLAFGVDLLEFGKRQVSHLSGRAQQSDPRYDSLSKELRELKEQRQQEQQERQQRQQQEAQAAERQALSETLSEMPAYARVATKRAFLDEVVNQLRTAYDPRTKLTISPEEAAELAYAELYGDLEAPAPAGRGNEPVPGRRGKSTSSKPTPRAKDGASTPPAFKPGSPEMLEWYAEEAAREATRERAERLNGRAG